MATAQQIAPLYYAQLNNDSRDQILAAGAGWAGYPLSFYYNSEPPLDIGIRNTMTKILYFEHATLPQAKWIELANAINRNVLTSDAIGIMALISTAANHQ